MITLVRRESPSQFMVYATPILAVIVTMLVGGYLLAPEGKNAFDVIRTVFWDPLFNETVASYTRPQLLVKAAPLIMIALGLSFGFRAGIWNIGAEGQYIMGAIVAAAVGIALHPNESFLVFPAMILGGILGGLGWAMIPAILRARLGVNEILVSLMLVYVAQFYLAHMATGALKNPAAMGFPESISFNEYASANNGELWAGTGIHLGVVTALILVIVAAVILSRHMFGFQVRVTGSSPRAARFMGVNPNLLVILCMGISGGLAGLAGMFELTGPVGKLTTTFNVGYGFTAIIVAFLGRLHPIGVMLAGLLMALTYIGGELAQFMLNMPAASTLALQGMLLFFLLALDVLVHFKFVWGAK